MDEVRTSSHLVEIKRWAVKEAFVLLKWRVILLKSSEKRDEELVG